MRAFGVHPSASGFDTAAREYERGRPGYPEDAVRWLVESLRIGPGTTVVDLAAGTGKLTRLLVPTGAGIIAIEPMAGMREQLARSLPEVPLFEGTAESIPLSSACADSITVAQAFHWFKAKEALAEIHRVLRPRGRLGSGLEPSGPVRRGPKGAGRDNQPSSR